MSILLKNKHRMKLKHLKATYDSPDPFDFSIDRLKKRRNIRIENDTVRLDEHNIRKGIRNYIMMRGMRNLLQ